MSGRRALVLLHGLWLGAWALGRLQKYFAEAGYGDIQLFAWPTVRPRLDDNAARLRAFAAALEAGRIDWVGHSLGGVLALRMLSAWDDRPPGRIVCLGSPLTGSRTASRMAGNRVGRRLVGAGIVDGVLASSAAEWCAPAVVGDTGVIAGTKGMGAGRLIGHLDPPHDGTVMVSETRLPGIADHLLLDVSHSGLLLSRAAAAAADAFLRHGRFQSSASSFSR